MKTFKKYTPFIVSALLMWIVLYFIYPAFQYYVDPDGTAYLTISRRYAEGIYVQAINGYWSPWSCWLTAILIRNGLQPIPASVIINTLGATGFLYITQSFFLKFDVARKLQWWFNGALVVFLCYAVFAQSFDDIWECFFLLAALRIMLVKSFTTNPELWIVTGFIGALAYFAKAYSFPFFILNILCCAYLLSENKVQWLKISVTSIATMLVVSFPWIYALHYKYGIWTTSTAGSLNMSWYLVGHPYWTDNIKLLLPPAYPDSPYYWEDPYVSNGITPHFWSSWHLFGLQFIRIGVNLFRLLISSLQLSIFFTVTGLVVLGALRRRKLWSNYPIAIRVIALSFLLFPLGYLPINFESRYLWYMLPISLVLIDYIVKRNIPFLTKRMGLNAIYAMLALSLTIYPIAQLWKIANSGADRDAKMASALKANGIRGKFTSNINTSRQMQSVARIAYFTGNSYYSIPYPDKVTSEELLKEIRRYDIDYYVVFEGSRFNLPNALKNEQGNSFPELKVHNITGLKIYRIKD